MGSDLAIVNAAKASFQKESIEYGGPENRILHFLIREGHTSPFRHSFVTFEVKAPLEVARQWWKYVVGSDHTMDGWNEASRRYITMDTEFYVPGSLEWRSKPESRKQGSGPLLSQSDGYLLTQQLLDYVAEGRNLYEWAMNEMNVAPEMARLFLPAYSLYTVWRWSASLQSVVHFLTQRLGSDAQHEITKYAEAVRELLEPHFPNTVDAILNYEKESF